MVESSEGWSCGASLEVDDREMSDLLIGMARGEHGTEDDPPVEPTKVWVTTPEGRAEHLGRELDCKKCDESGVPKTG